MPTTYEAISILVLFFVPGYIASQIYVRNDPTAETSQPRYLLSVALWSAFVHAIALPRTIEILPTLRALTIDAGVFLSWFATYLVAVPVVLGPVAGVLVRTRIVSRGLALVGMSNDVQLPTAWDFALRPGRPGAFVRVHLRSNEVLGGRLGRESLAGVSPHAHDLFLQQRITLGSDGWFESELPSSSGIWVAAGDITYVEFFEGDR